MTQQALERVAAIHKKSDHQRWTGFPRADRQEYYCLEDQQAWPCRTQVAINGGHSKSEKPDSGSMRRQ